MAHRLALEVPLARGARCDVYADLLVLSQHGRILGEKLADDDERVEEEVVIQEEGGAWGGRVGRGGGGATGAAVG